MTRITWIVGVACLAACRPDTTRPAITPYPEAAGVEIRLRQPEAIRRLAEALQAESLTPARVQLRDGYLETGWLDSATGRPTTRRRLGTAVVRLRGWTDPGRPGNTVLTVETVYRPFADPSLPDRELERQVPRTHPIAVKVEQVLAALLERYGGPPPAAEQERRGASGPGGRTAEAGGEAVESEGEEEPSDTAE